MKQKKCWEFEELFKLKQFINSEDIRPLKGSKKS
jgi:hypothetical protein